MLVSVVIPVYNEERYIKRCLESLKKQTFKDFEIILVDDWSTDNTIQLASEYKNDLNLKILKQNHQWPWEARNLWAKEAKWDILVLVDADMYFDENYIKELIKPIVDWNEFWTSHWVELIGNPKNIFARVWWLNRILTSWDRTWVFRAIKKDIFLKSGWFDSSKWYFDDDLSKLWKWALFVKKSICYHNNPETFWEYFYHSMWVWESFAQNKKALVSYLRKYSKLLVILLFFILLIIIWIIKLQIWIIKALWYVFVWLILFFIIITEIIAIKRIIKEKKDEKVSLLINYLRAVPLVWISRLSGYIVGFIKYFIKPKNKFNK